jgi:hypothetical protein
MIYTIGFSPSYNKILSTGQPVFKVGKKDDYAGGYAFLTEKDAQRRIKEAYHSYYEVFGLKAYWGVDTYPAPDGWWHYLLFDREIVKLDPVCSWCKTRHRPQDYCLR